jgi:hypothetical protein
MLRRAPTLTFLFFAGISSLSAQSTVQGLVCDHAHRAVVDARVVLEQAENGQPHEVRSDTAGNFRLVSLESGRYELKTQVSGYYPIRIDFTLRARQNLSIRVELQPKDAHAETIEVRAYSSELDVEKTGSSYTLTNQDLERLPEPLTDSTNSLVVNLMPGASDSHDNFVAVRGTEFSLHEFINGVSFLDNTQPQFGPGTSPQIFETVDLMTGGFTPEYGNRFGGVLDITTRSGAELDGHGNINFRGATLNNNDLNGEYGGEAGKLGYYFFADGFTSARFLDPPEPVELYDFGKGARGASQFDWHVGDDTFKLLLLGGGDNSEQPNITDDQAVGRNAQRHLRQQTGVLSWLHIFSPQTLLSTSVYERTGSDHVLPTTDPITPLSMASRSTLTLGVKSDLSRYWRKQNFKVGVDLVRLRENEHFFFDGRGDPDTFPAYDGGTRGGQASIYGQDHFSPVRNVSVDAGIRYDYFDLLNTAVQVSPRIGLAYHLTKTKSVLHTAYDRYFSPPPIEYSLLASFIGRHTTVPNQRVGDVRAYTQNYFEVGWAQQISRQADLQVNGYLHTGHNSFENHEISISRVFVPVNFQAARSHGVEVVLNLRQRERAGVSARLQYALARSYFYGPVTGGFAGDEPLDLGERIIPAFDQTHTGTAQIFYFSHWRRLWTSAAMRYGSGTIIEGGSRLPQHLTADFGAGLTLCNFERGRLDFEADLTNISNNVYQIAKESEEIPIQYSPPRIVGASLKVHF